MPERLFLSLSKPAELRGSPQWILSTRGRLYGPSSIARVGYQMIANGCSMRLVPHRGAMQYAVVHFEVKMSRFGAVFQDDRPDRGRSPPMHALCIEQD